MTPYEDFLPYVLPYIDNVAAPQAVQQIRAAAIEFCEKTLIWRETVLGNTSPEVAEYTLPTPTDARVASLVSLYVNRYKLQQNNVDNMSSRRLQWNDIKGAPVYYLEDGQGGYRLTPVPDVELPTSAIVAYAPTRTSAELPDVVFERWAEVIAAGAMSRLHSQMGQPYFNGDMARLRLREYSIGVAKAQAEVNSGNGRSRSSVTPFSFV